MKGGGGEAAKRRNKGEKGAKRKAKKGVEEEAKEG